MTAYFRSREVPLKCRDCDEPAEYADSCPDPDKQGSNLNECGYTWRAFCRLHAAYRREHNTSRVTPILRCESQGLGRLDGGRAGGDCICYLCGRLYYQHPNDRDYPFMTVLCDGELVKL